MASADLSYELLCSICLSTFTDPVTLRCGHNFCRGCIDQFLNIQDESGVYSCPDCRARFRERPALIKNITLQNVAERFLSSQPHQEEITGICCTYCVDSPVPAVRSCLLCEASLCDKHLRVHSKSPEHVLTDPSTSLENRKCSTHKKILGNYGTADAACVCCSAGEHQGKQVEILDEDSEKKKKKKKLKHVLKKLITKKEKTEERAQSLGECRRNAQEKADGEAETPKPDVTQNLEMKKDELPRVMRPIEELCNMMDLLTVLHDPDTGDLCDPEEGGHDDVDVYVLTGILHAGFSDIVTYLQTTSPPNVMRSQPPSIQCLPSHTQTLPVPSTEYKGDGIMVRTGGAGGEGAAASEGRTYGQDPADISLDLNTAANDLLISDDLKTATWTNTEQSRSETAERFQCYQVMGSQGFTSGGHYWDVEVSGSDWWSVGMCYPSIDRRERRSFIGDNNKSWCLHGGRQGCNNQYSVRHDSKYIQLPHQISSDRVRIYVDYESGQLSFYELCDPIRHLHTFTATFTEPLHAVLWVWKGYIKISGGRSSCEEPSS